MSEATLWTSLATMTVGGIIGIGGGLVREWFVERHRRIREERSLSQAIVAEISALVEIVRRRRYIEELTRLIGEAKAESNLGWVPSFRFSARGNYFAVYQANLVRLGILHHLEPGLVVQYYTQASSILEDIKDMGDGKLSPLSRKEAIRRLEELLGLFQDTDGLGRRLAGLPPRS